MTSLEAMACGAAVLGAAVGAVQYAVLDGETGCLVPPNDPEALGKALARLYRSPALLQELGMRGRRRVQQHFTWSRIAAQIVEVYEEAWAKASFAEEPAVAAEEKDWVSSGRGNARREPVAVPAH